MYPDYSGIHKALAIVFMQPFFCIFRYHIKRSKQTTTQRFRSLYLTYANAG